MLHRSWLAPSFYCLDLNLNTYCTQFLRCVKINCGYRQRSGSDAFEPESGDRGMTGPISDNEPAERVIELRLPSKLGYEKVAMDTASSLARRMGFLPDRVEALRTAIAEAVTNAIEHGNAHDSEMRVLVMLTAREDELVVRVADQGRKQLDQGSIVPTPRIEDALNRQDKGGWGIWLIRELMDEVEFTTAPSGGNQVRMVIHLER